MEMHKAALVASAMETLVVKKSFAESQALLPTLEKEVTEAVNLIEISTDRDFLNR